MITQITLLNTGLASDTNGNLYFCMAGDKSTYGVLVLSDPKMNLEQNSAFAPTIQINPILSLAHAPTSSPTSALGNY